MRILFLSHRIPYPPDKGDKIRAYHEMSGLVKHGHEVHVLAFADDAADLRYETALRQLCASAQVVRLGPARARWRAIRRLFTGTPLSVGYFESSAMRGLVRDRLGLLTPDAVVVFSSTMAQYVPPEMTKHTIVDLVDVDSEKWRAYASGSRSPLSWLHRIEASRLRRYEEGILERFERTVVTTDRERDLLSPVRTGATVRRLHVLSNGVDLEYFQPGLGALVGRLPDDELVRFPLPIVPLLVFTGAMDYRPNVEGVCEFVETVFPLVRAAEPAAELMIVGRNPTGAVRRLGAVEGVTVTGAVADVRPYLAAARVAVVPLRIARGIQNKVLEALASGCAVVATPESVAGLKLEPGTHALVASSPDDLARAIVAVIRDEPLRRRLQAAGRAFVEQRHQWSPVLQAFTAMVETVSRRKAVAV
jgi:sugar transferase (PEP-CTERM/EpsH1 system associated)